MQFDIITIFPEIFDSFLKESLIARAQKKSLIKIRVHNLRNWTSNVHQTIDDRPYGGGVGMVLKIEPIYRAVKKIKRKEKTKVILFTPRGKKFNQKMVCQLSKLDQIIMICGRYEGVDERVAKHIADIELSVGDYVLMGGDLPAMMTIETIARLIPGVLGRSDLLLDERITKEKGFIEYPQYTRPEVFLPSSLIKDGKSKLKKRTKWRVPKILLSGHHKRIGQWREKHQKVIEK